MNHFSGFWLGMVTIFAEGKQLLQTQTYNTLVHKISAELPTICQQESIISQTTSNTYSPCVEHWWWPGSRYSVGHPGMDCVYKSFPYLLPSWPSPPFRTWWYHYLKTSFQFLHYLRYQQYSIKLLNIQYKQQKCYFCYYSGAVTPLRIR